MKEAILLSLLLLLGCRAKEDASLVFFASREAPLGWVTLKAYDDERFELIYSGVRDADKEVYPGLFTFKNDTIYFKYSDSIPERLNSFKAFVKGNVIQYVGGKYPEGMEIHKNLLK